jgi:hypothetical protein
MFTLSRSSPFIILSGRRLTRSGLGSVRKSAKPRCLRRLRELITLRSGSILRMELSDLKILNPLPLRLLSSPVRIRSQKSVVEKMCLKGVPAKRVQVELSQVGLPQSIPGCVYFEDFGVKK